MADPSPPPDEWGGWGVRFAADADFPAGPRSLGGGAEAEACGEVAEWRRAAQVRGCRSAQLFTHGGVSEDDVVQGCLGDGGLVCALSVVATRPALLQRLFTKPGAEHRPSALAGADGRCCVRLHRPCGLTADEGGEPELGGWADVWVDDRVPCRGDGTPAFAHCRHPDAMWVQMAEKAAAKLRGSYAAAAACSVEVALEDLTGCWTEEVPLGATPAARAAALGGAGWGELAELLRTTLLTAVAADDAGAAAAGGIIPGGAYAVLRMLEVDGVRLLRLRAGAHSPTWCGAWAENSDEWEKHPPVAAAAGWRRGAAAAGLFWMPADEFAARFSALRAGRLFGDAAHARWRRAGGAPARGRWRGDSAGGAPVAPDPAAPDTWRRNPQWLLTLPAATASAGARVALRVSRACADRFPDAVGIHVVRAHPSGRRAVREGRAVVAASGYRHARSATLFFAAGPGDFVVACSTRRRGAEADFVVDAAADAPARLRALPPAPPGGVDAAAVRDALQRLLDPVARPLRAAADARQLRAAFTELDAGGDGALDGAEFRAALEGLDSFGAPPRRDDRRMARMFAEVDANGDGMIGFDEFCLFVSRMRRE